MSVALEKQTSLQLDGSKYQYLSEFLEDLPDNSYVNKVLTGCGGTTVALSNSVDYVICVPFISMIINKCEQHPEVFGLYGEVTNAALMSYIETQTLNMRPKKIMVTYDSLVRLCDLINPNEYKLLVDEAHKLLDSASFRQRAVRSVMKNYERFRSYVFMTATPVKEEYQLPELRSIPQVEIDWGDIVPVELTKMQVEPSNLVERLLLLCVEHLKGSIEGTPYFFMNTVTGICKLVKALSKLDSGINSETVKIICADNEFNRKKIESHLGRKWKPSKVSDVGGSIYFCTATAFEGSDIYCKTGRTYIVSDGTKEHTKHDILTTIPQIIGRLRNSIYKNQVTLVYTDTPYYRYMTPEEYAEVVNEQLKNSAVYIEDYQMVKTEAAKSSLYETALTNAYLYVDNDVMEVDAWSWHNEMHNYDVVNCQYSVRLEGVELINKVPYKYGEVVEELGKLEGADKLLVGKRADFREVAKTYVALKDKPLKTRAEVVRLAAIEGEYHFIHEAYLLLGEEGFKRHKWLKKPIKQHVLLHSKGRHKDKVRAMLNLKVGWKYSSAELKEKYSNIPDFSRLEDYYLVRKCRFRKDGKNLRGYIIQGVAQ